MAKKYVLINEYGNSKKPIATANNIIDIRKKAYAIAFEKAKKGKLVSESKHSKISTSDSYIVYEMPEYANEKDYGKNKLPISEVGSVFAIKRKYVSDKYIKMYGKDEIIEVKYHTLPYHLGKNYVLNKNGTLGKQIY